jgi:D-alanine-D-alanine ligase-like ATP-grasp enzyme
MKIKELKIYLIYESRRDWISRNKNVHNKDFFSRFLASENEVKIIEEILIKNKFDVEVLMYPKYTMKQIKEIISKKSKTIVWNLTDGYENFIGAYVPSFVHFFNKPYIGSPTFVQILCQNKHMTKLILKDMGIDTPNWIHIDENCNLNLINFSNLQYPLFIKPSKYDNSIGTEFINPVSNNLSETINKINELRLNGIQDILIEKYISGKEITITAVHSDKWYILPIERNYDGDYISSYSKDNEKGFLKTYAQALGLSEKDVLGLYEEIREVKPVDTQKEEEVEEKHKISKLKIFIGIIFLIIISIAVVKTLELIDKKSKSTEKTIVVEEEKFEFTQEQKQENVSADISEIEEVKETKEEIQVTKMTKKVEIKLTGKVWLQVFINGKKEKEGEFTASEQLVFEGSETDQIFVKVGNIKNADVYFNGVAEDESTAYKNVWKKTF